MQAFIVPDEYTFDGRYRSSLLERETAMLNEFRNFIMRGNVLELAVGIIIGAAFTSIINSVVNDIISPLIGLATGGVDFSDLRIVLRPAVGDTPEVALGIGLLINAIINFLIVAFVLFLIIRAYNNALDRFKRKEAAPGEPVNKSCPYCAMDIPFKATRCPNCTSQLTDGAGPVVARQGSVTPR
jgi:large conductance mechanosensitive channel